MSTSKRKLAKSGLRVYLEAGAVLCGRGSAAKQSGKNNETLTAVLHRRLRDASTSLQEAGRSPLDLPADLPIQQHRLQALVADASLTVLQNIRQFALPAPVVSEAAAPIFGVQDTKTLTLLSSVVARWGLIPLVQPGVLPPHMYDGDVQPLRDGPVNSQTLANFTKSVLDLLFPPAIEGASSSKALADSFQDILLPHLLSILLACLVDLNHRGREWASEALSKLLIRLVDSCRSAPPPLTAIRQPSSKFCTDRSSELWLSQGSWTACSNPRVAHLGHNAAFVRAAVQKRRCDSSASHKRGLR